MFFIQKAKDIAQMVGNFLGSIGEIAMGNIGAAANALENGLATALTLVISFLAKLIHLDGVTAKIRAALNKIRGKVENMMAKVAKWIAEKGKSFWKKTKETATNVKDKLFAWWNESSPVKLANGEKHTIQFDRQGGKQKLRIHSTPQDYIAYVEGISASDENKAKLRTLANEIQQMVNVYDDKSQNEKEQWEKEIVQKLNKLARLTEKYTVDQGPDEMPPSVVKWGAPNSEGFGTGFTAETLSTDYVTGEPSTSEKKSVYGWDLVRGRQKVSLAGNPTSVYVKGHLLNSKLGGPANVFNLTPITSEMNGQHKDEVESFVKKMITGKSNSRDSQTKKYVGYYFVKVHYDKHKNPRDISTFNDENERLNVELTNTTSLIQRAELVEKIEKNQNIKKLIEYEEINLTTGFTCKWRRKSYDSNTKKWNYDETDPLNEKFIPHILPRDIHDYKKYIQ